MPAYQHEVEEKKKDNLKKVRSAWLKKSALTRCQNTGLHASAGLVFKLDCMFVCI